MLRQRPIKSLWRRLKVEKFYCRWFATRGEAMYEVIDWLNFYNHKRLHLTLVHVSPMTFEQRCSNGPAARKNVRIMGASKVRRTEARSLLKRRGLLDIAASAP